MLWNKALFLHYKCVRYRIQNWNPHLSEHKKADIHFNVKIFHMSTLYRNTLVGVFILLLLACKFTEIENKRVQRGRE